MDKGSKEIEGCKEGTQESPVVGQSKAVDQTFGKSKAELSAILASKKDACMSASEI